MPSNHITISNAWSDPLMPNAVLAHVVLMSIACIVVLPYSIYLANTRHIESLYPFIDKYVQSIKQSLQLTDRTDLYARNTYTTQSNDTWFHMHNTLTFVATLLIISGWISIFLHNSDSKLTEHVNDLHYIVGILVILVMIFIQPKLGTTTTKHDVHNRLKHRYLGYTIFVGCVYCVLSGWSILFDRYLPE